MIAIVALTFATACEPNTPLNLQDKLSVVSAKILQTAVGTYLTNQVVPIASAKVVSLLTTNTGIPGSGILIPNLSPGFNIPITGNPVRLEVEVSAISAIPNKTYWVILRDKSGYLLGYNKVQFKPYTSPNNERDITIIQSYEANRTTKTLVVVGSNDKAISPFISEVTALPSKIAKTNEENCLNAIKNEGIFSLFSQAGKEACSKSAILSGDDVNKIAQKYLTVDISENDPTKVQTK